MARKCTICSHAHQRRIDAELVEQVPNRRIATQFDVSESSVRRHAASHLSRVAVQAATEERETDHFQKLARLERVLYTVLDARLADEDHSMVLRTHAALLRHYEFEVRLGEIETIRRDLAELAETVREREIER